jgi:colicin import membrane protein
VRNLWQKNKGNIVLQIKLNPSLCISLLLHVMVLLLLIMSFEFSHTAIVVENADQNMKVINAVAMDTPMPSAQVTPPKPTPPIQQPSPTPPTPAVKTIETSKKLPDPVVEKQKAIALDELHKKQLALQKKALEQKLLDDINKQTAKVKKAKQKAIEQAMEKELKEQANKALQKQLLVAAERAAGAKVQGIVDKYKALILQSISQRWLVPTGIDKNLSAELLIRLAPGGTVLDVQVIKSSGVLALDKSARDAVFKASPLPVPEDVAAFDQFRQFVLKVKPNDVVMT